MPTGRMTFQVIGSIVTPTAAQLETHWSTRNPAYLNQTSMPKLNPNDNASQAF